MFRRSFLQKLSYAGATTLALTPATKANGNSTVVFSVKGFTCVTCAVGLETMLRRQNGVLRAQASYAENQVRIEFNPAVIAEKSLKQSILELGFRVADQHGH